MNLTALSLVLLGAVIHATWNYAAKKAHGDARFSFFSSLFHALFWGPLVIWLGWEVVPTWGWLAWSLIGLSGFVHWVYFIALFTGYRKSDFTIVYPVARGSAPLASSAVAVALFGEHIATLGVAGIGCIVFGVFLLTGGPALFKVHRSASDVVRLKAGVFWGVLTGGLIASYTVLDAYIVKVIAISPILFDYWANILRLPYAVIPVLRDIPEAKRHWALQWKYALWVAILSPVGYVCVLYAMRIAPVSHVAPARELSMLFAAVIGGQLLGEKDRVFRILGAIAIAGGVMSLALSS